MAARERLGRRSAFATREYVYRARDCFEIDEVEGYEITRKRVFFDDVVLVTRHSFRPWPVAILLGLIAALFGIMAAAFGSSDRIAGFSFFVLSMLSLLVIVVLLSIGGDVITIQGKRTMARMYFLLRRNRAAEVYRLACRLARERQQRLAREIAGRERIASPLRPANPDRPA
jgi:hypothetical protein